MTPAAKPFCPECAEQGIRKLFATPGLRGVHRRFKHGVKGVSYNSAQAQKRRAVKATVAASASSTTTTTIVPSTKAKTPKAKKASKHHEQVKHRQPQPETIRPDILFYSVGRTEEFIKGLADKAGVPPQQFVHWVSESLFHSSRR